MSEIKTQKTYRPAVGGHMMVVGTTHAGKHTLLETQLALRETDAPFSFNSDEALDHDADDQPPAAH